MSKVEAADLVDGGKLTVGQLKAYVMASSTSGTSRLNPSITKAHAVQIFRDALNGRSDDEVISPRRWDGRATGDRLMAMNVLRECA